MKVSLESLKNAAAWEKAGVALPRFDIAKMRAASHEHPVWVHFGAGNIFRAFIAALQHRLLDAGEAACGIVAADTFDVDNIRLIYGGYDKLTLAATLNPDATVGLQIIASVSEALVGQTSAAEDWARLVEIFENNKEYEEMYLNCPIAIHIDAGNSTKGKTKELIPELVGWIKACGYDCSVKPDSFVASTIADRLSK